MKTQPIKVTTQPAKKFPGVLAAFIIAVLAFSALPIARSADLYWTGDSLYATPPVAGGGSWSTDTGEVNWSKTRTSSANVSWIDGDVAHFLGSNGGTVTLGTNITAAGINFDSGASTFTIKTNGNVLTVQGAGIGNDSGKIQSITNNGEARGTSGGITIFANFLSTSTAGDATITNEGAAASATSIGASGGLTQFYNTSNGGRATIINNGSAAQATQGGVTQFLDTSSAGRATITNNGANDGRSVRGTEPGATFFEGASSAGSAAITNNGAPVSGAGGITVFRSTSSAGSATITNNGAPASGAGGTTEFFDRSDGGTARAITNGNGRFDISGLSTTGMGIGSIEGSGNYFLGSKTLTVGGNNLSTTVSGVIQDRGIRGDAGGSLTKVGTGTLTLSGNNAYTGGTNITGGVLSIGTDSNLGTGGIGISNNAELLTTGPSFSSGKGIVLGAGGGTLASVTGATATYGGMISGSGGLSIGDATDAGTIVLTGNNTYSGVTTINAGALQLGNGGTSGSITGNVTDNGTLAFDRSDSVRFGSVISGAGSLVQLGTGTTTLTSAGNSVGTTVISGGTLLINGSLASSTVTAGNGTTLGGAGSITGVVTLASGATLAPGASAQTTGVLTVGSLILNPGSILAYDLQTPNLIGPQNDRVDVRGNLTLGGTLNVTDAGSFASTPGSYRLINYTGTLTGTASDLKIGRTPGYTPSDVFVQTVVPGQVNLITVLSGLPVEYWDGSGVAGSGVISGGRGTWNNSAPSWTNANGTINQGWIPGMAIFTGTAGTVTLGENVSAMSMQFSTDGYQIAGNGHTIALLGMPNGHLSLIRVDPGITATIAATLVGKGGLNKADNGTLILSGDNTYTGGTVISGGTLQIGSGGTTGSIAGDVTNYGVLDFNLSGALTFGGVISGKGSVQQNGTGTTVLLADNAYRGGTNLNGGILAVNGDGNLGTGALSFNSGTLEALAAGGGIVSSKAITLNAGGGMFLADVGTNSTLSGVISGVGTWTKTGPGTLTLTGANTYAGGTTVSAGTLQIGNRGTSGIITGNITNNGTVAFDRSDSVTFSGAIAGHGKLVQLGSGTLTLVGNNGYSGGTAVNDGTLVAASNNALGIGPVSVAGSSSTLQINSGVTLTNLLSLHNGGTLNNSGTLNGGSSALLVSLGGTIVNNAGGVITANQIQFTQAPATLVNSGTINANVEFANFANTVRLFTGSSIVGHLGLGTSAGSNLILDGPGTQSVRQAVTGTMTNSGTLTKQGAGTWIIDEELNAPVSTNVLAGVLTVNNTLNSPFVTVQHGATLMGSGNISGSVTNFGEISPGNSLGTLTINGNYTQARSGAFNVEIASPTHYDRLTVTGHANLDGTLRLTLLSGFRPVSSDNFTILTAGKGISGAFRTVIGPTGVPLQVIYGQHGVVQVTSDPPKQAAPQPEFHLSDGTPNSTTALLANNTFNGFGSLAGRLAASNKSSSIGITFDAGEFDFQGHHGETYGFPIAGQFKINDRARLEYEIPLQYVELPGSNILQAGLTLDLPVKVITASDRNPWTWTVTPTAAFASSGSKELIGAGALTNVISYGWHDITLTYGNYISFFGGHRLTSNDDQFGTAVSQQIMKNGLRVSIPFAKSWLFESYAIYTQFFQSAPVSSYVTIGAEVGHNFVTHLYGREVDLGYLSAGLYTELGNQYSSGHFKIGSAWRF